jgi:uncharacterized membrane protein YcaP (DUF421 family)
MTIIDQLFGKHGQDLSALQMGCRALVMFFVTLIIIRISGMRSFGKKSAFDSIIVIMLGAILSRVVVGSSAFLPTVVAGLVFAVVHRLLAWLSVQHDNIGALIKGKSISLYSRGEFNKRNMLLSTISHKDIMEEVHEQLNQATLDNIEQIFMERSGKISIIKKLESIQ